MAKELFGWQGKVLWIDLKEKSYKDIDVSDIVADYIGARGLAAKLAWDYMTPGTKAFDEGNLLMFMNGPLSGTLVPGGGKGYVFGIAPQGYPEHFSRSSVGGGWAANLKCCGYDGVILNGKSDEKLILEIVDNGVKFHNADKYWGMDTHDTQDMLEENFGPYADYLVIGPAGENKVRFATIMCDSDKAAGQGGYGAVMGDKHVKGIVFNGTQYGVKVADNSAILKLREHRLANMTGFYDGKGPVPDSPFVGLTTSIPLEDIKNDPDAGEISFVTGGCRGCGMAPYGCFTGFTDIYHAKDVKPHYGYKNVSGVVKCVELFALGYTPGDTMSWPSSVNWVQTKYLKETTGNSYMLPRDYRRGTEAVNIMNRMGINAWEMCTWLVYFGNLATIGVDVSETFGFDWDIEDPTCLPRLMEMIGRREGAGDLFAEGVARVAVKYGHLEYATAGFNGYGDHGLGSHCYNFFEYPHWTTAALGYATDTRDPLSDTLHRASLYGLQREQYGWTEERQEEMFGSRYAFGPDATLRKVYGGPMEDDEYDDLAYLGKEYTVFKMQNRSVCTASGVFCDGMYPCVTVDPDYEAKFLTAVTGVEYTTEKLEQIGEKVYNMERCFNIAEFGRNKSFDITIADTRDPRGDTITGKKFDPVRFEKLLDRYYALREWDENGYPTEQKLLALGLDQCNDAIKELRKQNAKFDYAPHNLK